MLYRAISFFALAGGQTVTIYCSCGAEPLHLRLGNKYLYADCYCCYCEERHNYIYQHKGSLADPPFVLGCEIFDIKLASVGGSAGILAAMDEESAMILDYADDLKDCFVQPTIIGNSLLSLNRLIIGHSCQCAVCNQEDLDVLIQADRLTLLCPHCGASAFLKAARPADLLLLSKIKSIGLLESELRIGY